MPPWAVQCVTAALDSCRGPTTRLTNDCLDDSHIFSGRFTICATLFKDDMHCIVDISVPCLVDVED